MQQISNYRVEDTPIGSGGMGRVLKGYAPNGSPVAIKEILPQFVSDLEYRVRIEREIKFLQKLNNPNIVKTYDHFQIDDKLYIIMELVEGLNIEQYVTQNNGPVSLDYAVKFMLNILEVMQYIHEQNIVHRDIKPSNIMIRYDGRICVLDFGIAKDMQNVGGTSLGTVLGTDGYMSPEQADGMSVDHRTDIYSLGCVFYYMLTGHHAYQKLGTEIETALSIVNNPFPRLSKYVSGIPSAIQEVMDRATDKNMLRRYQSCREFRVDLMKAAGVGTQINTGNQSSVLSVSVGRENCDIIVGMNNFKVSRHHADISFKQFTGGAFYVYTDNSSNGTLIDGKLFTRGMVCNIPKGAMPIIYLAGEMTCQLDWNEVCSLIDAKVKEYNDTEQSKSSEAPQKANTKLQTKQSKEKHQTIGQMDMLTAVKTCFSKYATFKGRATRAEFWYFYLFNFIIQGLLFGLGAAVNTSEPLIFVYIYGAIILLPYLAVFMRRLHDVNSGIKSFLLIVIGLFLPLVNIVALVRFFMLTCAKGTDGPNDYD